MIYSMQSPTFNGEAWAHEPVLDSTRAFNIIYNTLICKKSKVTKNKHQIIVFLRGRDYI
jgi:hypothetical protein